MKCVQIRNFFWSVISGYRKIRTRKNSVFRHFSRSESKSKNNKNRLLSSSFGYCLLFVYLFYNFKNKRILLQRQRILKDNPSMQTSPRIKIKNLLNFLLECSKGSSNFLYNSLLHEKFKFLVRLK